MRKTKIICSIGPASETPEIIEKMMLAGMDCARFNFSHGTHESHRERMDRIKQVREKLGINVAIMLDTKGPEIRINEVEGGSIFLEEGQKISIEYGDGLCSESVLKIASKDISPYLGKGNRILIDDGKIALNVENISEGFIDCTVLNGGEVKSRKSINLPGIEIDMPYLSEADKADILFGISQDIDFIAASFVRSRDDVDTLRKFLSDNGGGGIAIISKIENTSGVRNLEEIVASSDGVMVARGDLGVEISFDKLPAIQKDIIESCYWNGKYVVTATQMLESMTTNPRPTRAEVSDVANAVYDGTTAIMLSGETAAGKYPVEAVKTMAEIAVTTEENINYKKRFLTNELEISNNIPNAISNAACLVSYSLNVKAIIAITQSGRTAHLISAYRPSCDIISPCTNDRICRQLNLRWGVHPVKAVQQSNTDMIMEHAVGLSLKTGLVKKGDLAVIVGAFVGQKHTDMLRLYTL